MAYRAKIKVQMLNIDRATGGLLTVARQDLDFEVLVNEPGEIILKAQAEFELKYGPDLRVRVCNVQERTSAILYACPKALVPQSAPQRLMAAQRAYSARRAEGR